MPKKIFSPARLFLSLLLLTTLFLSPVFLCYGQEKPLLSDEEMTLNKAEEVYQKGNPYEALELCFRVIADSPDNQERITASQKISRIYLALNQPEKALEEAGRSKIYQEAYQPSQEQKDVDDTLKVAAGVCYGGKFPEAESLLNEIIKKYPGSLQEARALNYLACSSYHQKNYSRAIPVYQEVIRKFPDTKQSLRALRWMGSMYFLRREYDQAIEIEKEVVDRYYAYAKAVGPQTIPEDADSPERLKTLDKYLSYQQQAVLALYQTGKCFEYKSDYREAVNTYLTLLNDYPDIPFKYMVVMELGRNYYFLRDYPNARERFKEITENCVPSTLVDQARKNIKDIERMLKKK